MLSAAPYEIRQQDATAHIVFSKTDAATGYVVFQPNVVLAAGPVMSASKPCVMLASQTAGKLLLSVADPDLNFLDVEKGSGAWGYSQPSTLTITLQGQWQTAERSAQISATTSAPGKTLLRLECRDGVTTTVNLVPATVALKGP